MKKNKNILIIIIFTLMFFITGCSQNSSPKKVAMEVLKRLSSGDYSNIEELIYTKAFFTEDSFERIMIERGLDIKGNSTFKYVGVSKERTDKEGHKIVQVSIDLDDGKHCVIDTIKVDDEWLIYDETFIENFVMKIIVPKDVEVSLDGITLSNNYLSDEHDIDYYYPDKEDIKKTIKDNADIYVITDALVGGYKITFSYNNENYVDAIGSNVSYLTYYNEEFINYKIGNDNYFDFYSGICKDNSNLNILKDYLNTTISKIYEIADKRSDFSNISNYFSSNYKDTAKDLYDKFIKKVYINDSNLEKRVNKIYNLRIQNMNIKDITIYDDNNIAISLSYELKYRYKYLDLNDNAKSNSSSVNIDDIYILSKNNSSYLIEDVYFFLGGNY